MKLFMNNDMSDHREYNLSKEEKNQQNWIVEVEFTDVKFPSPQLKTKGCMVHFEQKCKT